MQIPKRYIIESQGEYAIDNIQLAIGAGLPRLPHPLVNAMDVFENYNKYINSNSEQRKSNRLYSDSKYVDNLKQAMIRLGHTNAVDQNRYPSDGEIALVRLQQIGFVFSDTEAKRFIAAYNATPTQQQMFSKIDGTTSYAVFTPFLYTDRIKAAFIAAVTDPTLPMNVNIDRARTIVADTIEDSEPFANIKTDEGQRLIAEFNRRVDAIQTNNRPYAERIVLAQMKNERYEQQIKLIQRGIELELRNLAGVKLGYVDPPSNNTIWRGNDLDTAGQLAGFQLKGGDRDEFERDAYKAYVARGYKHELVSTPTAAPQPAGITYSPADCYFVEGSNQLPNPIPNGFRPGGFVGNKPLICRAP